MFNDQFSMLNPAERGFQYSSKGMINDEMKVVPVMKARSGITGANVATDCSHTAIETEKPLYRYSVLPALTIETKDSS